MLGRDGTEWLVEAKIVYVGNATSAVRAAAAQLLMYRYLLYSDPQPAMLALFSESVGDVYVASLETVGIGSAWREDDGWGFSRHAFSA